MGGREVVHQAAAGRDPPSPITLRLAKAYSAFRGRPCSRPRGRRVREARLSLLTAAAARGLGLLGIQVVERM